MGSRGDVNRRSLEFFIPTEWFVKQLINFLDDEQGAELAEYAIGVAILVAVAIICYQLLGTAVNTKMSRVANEVQK